MIKSENWNFEEREKSVKSHRLSKGICLMKHYQRKLTEEKTSMTINFLED